MFNYFLKKFYDDYILKNVEECYKSAKDLDIKIDKYTKLSRKNAIKKFTQVGLN